MFHRIFSRFSFHKKKHGFHFEFPHIRPHHGKKVWAFWMRRRGIEDEIRALCMHYREAILAGLGIFFIGVFVVGVWQTTNLRPPGKVSFQLEASGLAYGTIQEDSVFTLHASRALAAHEIKRLVRFHPPFAFSVTRKGKTALWNTALPAFAASESQQPQGTYLIQPLQPLAPDTIVSVSLSDTTIVDREYEWAFQVRGPFGVGETIPGNRTTEVPLNSAIEVTFNRDAVSFKNPSAFFDIQPAVSGKLEVRGNHLVFAPKALAPQTVYTVHIKRGLSNTFFPSDTIAQDVTFSFETAGTDREQGVFFEYQKDFFESPPNQKLAIPFYLTELNEKQSRTVKLSVTLYRFEKADDFLSAYRFLYDATEWTHYHSKKRQSVERLLSERGKKLFTFTPSEYETEGVSYFETPEVLTPGYYSIDTAVDGDHYAYALVQVSPIAAYHALSSEKSFVWVFDFPTKAPLGTATVGFLDDTNTAHRLGNVDQDGLFEFASPAAFHLIDELEQGKHQFLTIESPGNASFFIPFPRNAGLKARLSAWSHISTDRPMYRMSDSVGYWGFVRGRTDDFLGKKVRVGLYENFTYRGMSVPKSTEYVGEDVVVSDTGIISGTLSFSGLAPAVYFLATSLNGEVLSALPIEVVEYTKPAYRIEVIPRKKAIFAGEPAVFDIHALFFDGTPVPFLQLIANEDHTKKITLDANGRGVYTEPVPYDAKSSYPGIKTWLFSPLYSEEGSLAGNAFLSLYGPEISIASSQEHAPDRLGARAVVTLKTVALTPESFEGVKSAPAAGVSVRAKVYKRIWKKTESGEQYDPIEKIVRKKYEYTTREELVEELSGVTDVQGTWFVDRAFGARTEEDGGFRIEFSGTDRRGRIFTASEYVFANQRPDAGVAFTLSVEGETSDSRKDVSVGEEFRLHVDAVQGTTEIPISKVLIYHYGSSIHRVSVSPEAFARDKFFERFLPGTEYRAVMLGPHGFLESNGVTVALKKDDKALDISVSSDKERYRPGEKAHLSFEVKDRAGKPVQAELNVALVDEAVFSLVGVSQDSALESLLELDIVEPIRNGTSYLPPDLEVEMNGEGGAGRGLEYDRVGRAYFPDTAAYQSLRTGKNGRATLDVQLPDSVTAWRVTTRAFVSTKVLAGDDETRIKVSLPFFVDATTNNKYLVGDTPSVRVRAYGGSVVPSAPIVFELASTALGITNSETTQSPVATFSLPALPSGTHDLSFTARQGDMRDTLIRHIKVADSYLSHITSAQYPVSEKLTAIAGSANGPTTLVFTDGFRGAYYKALQNMRCNDCSLRLDRVIAHEKAQQLLQHFYGLRLQETFLDLTHYQREDGGLALVPYGSSSLDISVLAAYTARDALVHDNLDRFFKSVLLDAQADIHRSARALAGLAALGEPVLSRVHVALGKKGLSFDDYVYLALAQSTLGDKEGARRIYFGPLRDAFASEKDALFVSGHAASGALLAARLGLHEDAQRFLKTSDDTEQLFVLERLFALREHLQTIPLAGGALLKSRVTYQTHRRKDTIAFEGNGMHIMTLSPDEMKTLRFLDVRGDVTLAVSFESTFDRAAGDISQHPSLALKREITDGRGRPLSSIREGDVVRITLDPDIGKDAPGDRYQVVDYLPAGLVVLTGTYGDARARGAQLSDKDDCSPLWYPERIIGNVVILHIGKDFDRTGRCKDRTLHYHARVITKGIFQTQGALLQSLEMPNVLTQSKAGERVEIR